MRVVARLERNSRSARISLPVQPADKLTRFVCVLLLHSGAFFRPRPRQLVLIGRESPSDFQVERGDDFRAALIAPGLSITIAATGTPAGIWTLESSASTPLSTVVAMETAMASAMADHSLFRAQRLRRLHRTLAAMLALTFGTAEEAQRVSRAINVAHCRVGGKLRERVGVFPAGAAYSARDPALLRWVHATLLDSFLRIYELYVGHLTLEEKDRYCADASGIEPLLSIPDGYLPRSCSRAVRLR